MRQVSKSYETKASSSRSHAYVRKRLVGALFAILSVVGLMQPDAAHASPNATTIYPGECPPNGSFPVMCLQWVLGDYAGHPMEVDGCFGPVTTNGVRDVQNFFGLYPDTVVGRDTGSAFDTIMYFNSSDPDWQFWDAYCWPVIPTHS